jgi:hypothetical protein
MQVSVPQTGVNWIKNYFKLLITCGYFKQIADFYRSASALLCIFI